MFERTNIEVKLDAERGAVPDRTALKNLLKGVEIELPSYTEAPGKKVRPASVNQFDFDSLDTSRIASVLTADAGDFPLMEIRKIVLDAPPPTGPTE